jgi:hypothetical protein
MYDTYRPLSYLGPTKYGFVGLRAKKAFKEAKPRKPIYYEVPMLMWY